MPALGTTHHHTIDTITLIHRHVVIAIGCTLGLLLQDTIQRVQLDSSERQVKTFGVFPIDTTTTHIHREREEFAQYD
jgi:hypothetical protein